MHIAFYTRGMESGGSGEVGRVRQFTLVLDVINRYARNLYCKLLDIKLGVKKRG